MSVETPRLPATRDEIAALVPHQMAMCLLEFVKEWTEDTILCGTRSHAFPDNPLRHHGRLAALHLCEYGAQAMAVHGGLSSIRAGMIARPGLLAALRNVELAVDSVDPSGTLEVRARRLHGGADGWQYDFAVDRDGRRLAAGRATVIVPRTA